MAAIISWCVRCFQKQIISGSNCSCQVLYTNVQIGSLVESCFYSSSLTLQELRMFDFFLYFLSFLFLKSIFLLFFFFAGDWCYLFLGVFWVVVVVVIWITLNSFSYLQIHKRRVLDNSILNLFLPNNTVVMNMYSSIIWCVLSPSFSTHLLVNSSIYKFLYALKKINALVQ